LGAFLLALVTIGAQTIDTVTGGEMGRVATTVAPGLMIMAMILFMGKMSGVHLNLAVTLGFAARGNFPWCRVPGYIVAQLVGAVLACLFLYIVFGRLAPLPSISGPGDGFTAMQTFAVEVVLKFGLVSIILGTASKAQNVGHLSALAICGYVALAGL
jgi:aquaporin Z